MSVPGAGHVTRSNMGAVYGGNIKELGLSVLFMLGAIISFIVIMWVLKPLFKERKKHG